MLPHRMHLKGPWQYEWLSDSPRASDTEANASTAGDRSVPEIASPSARSGKVKLPAAWRTAFGRVAGTVRWRRRFQRPTNLEPHEAVFIVFDAVGGCAQVSVNGTDLGTIDNSDETVGFEITELLQPTNELTVELSFDPAASERPGGLWKPVALEIRQRDDD